MSTPTNKEATGKAAKKSTLQTVIENNYLKLLVSGDIWKMTETEIKEIEDSLNKFRKLIGAALKMHDDELKIRRDIHGNDHMATLEFFRKPREQKAGNSLLDELEM